MILFQSILHFSFFGFSRRDFLHFLISIRDFMPVKPRKSGVVYNQVLFVVVNSHRHVNRNSNQKHTTICLGEETL